MSFKILVILSQSSVLGPSGKMIIIDLPKFAKWGKTISLPLEFFLSYNNKQPLPLLKFLTHSRSPLGEQKRTISLANHLNSLTPTLMTEELSVHFRHLKRKSPLSTPWTNLNNFPSAFSLAPMSASPKIEPQEKKRGQPEPEDLRTTWRQIERKAPPGY